MTAAALFWCLLAALAFTTDAFFVLTNSVPKCLLVDVPEGTFVHVTWDIPQVLEMKDTSGRRKPTTLTISQVVSANSGARQKVTSAAHAKKPKRTKTPTKTQVLQETTGKIMYVTEADGQVNVCLKAQGASSAIPLLVNMDVNIGHDAAHYLHEEQEHHLSQLQVSVMRLQDELTNILKQADMAKQREVEFHNLSVNMHAASQYWPMVQIMVLILTGFTQVSAMVHFFKSQRLI